MRTGRLERRRRRRRLTNAAAVEDDEQREHDQDADQETVARVACGGRGLALGGTRGGCGFVRCFALGAAHFGAKLRITLNPAGHMSVEPSFSLPFACPWGLTEAEVHMYQ